MDNDLVGLLFKNDKNEKTADNQQSVSIADLLSLTDAAVQALDKKAHSGKMPGENVSFVSDRKRIDVITPMTSFIQDSLNGEKRKGFKNLAAASNNVNSSQLNSSSSSRASVSSHGSFSQRVKVSSKKLKEIKPPFDISVELGRESGGASFIDYQRKNENFGEEGKNHNFERVSSNPANTVSHENGDQKVQVADSEKSQSLTEPKVSKYQLASRNVHKKRDIEKNLESHNPSRNVSIINHTQERIDLQPFDSDSQVSITSVHAVSDNEQSKPQDGGSDSSKNMEEPVIVTVPEKIVTVSATTSLPSSDESLSESLPPKALIHPSKSAKSHTSTLKQGFVEGSNNLTDRPKKSGDLQIEQFSLNDKQKVLKNNFAKRQQHTGPMKRTVQPHILVPQTSKNTANSVKPTVPTNSSENTAESQVPSADVLTTAVAASAAVAATQPFIKAQYELETRMAEILERLSVIQTQSNDANKPDDQQSVSKPSSDSRLAELEKQVAEMTVKRLDHLEKIQEQQMQWQAHLMSMYQGKSPKPVPPPSDKLTNHVEDQVKPKYYPANIDKPPIITKSKIENYDKQGVRFAPRTPPPARANEKDNSLLDTPAPRHKPPMPTSYDSLDVQDFHRRSSSPIQQAKKAGFMEELLSGRYDENGSLIKPSPAHSPPTRLHHDAAKTRIQSEPFGVVKNANKLVHNLSDLNDEVRDLVTDAHNWPKDKVRKSPQQISERGDAPKKHSGPAPLDEYLVRPKDIPQSPYPEYQKKSTGTDAPVLNNFADAKEVLSKVKTCKSYLEQNLAAMLKSRKEEEVFTFIDDLAKDSSLAERTRLRKLVDEQIEAMRAELEQEIVEEMGKVKEQKVKFEVPVRDTNKVKATTQTNKPSGKLGVKAKIDTGLKKTKIDTAGKENKPTKSKGIAKSKTPPSKTHYEDEDYVTRVYGRAPYQNLRHTQRNPYLRYHTTVQPKPSRPTPVSDVIGTEIRSAKTQTSPYQQGAAPAEQIYFQPQIVSTTLAQPGTAIGQVVPMAIPLGAPRIEGGLTAQHLKPKSRSPSPKRSITQPENVALVSYPEADNIKQKKKLESLNVQVLPSVDIESVPAVIHTSEPDDHDQSHIKSELVKDEMEEIDEVDEEEDVMSGDGILLPGYSAPTQQYQGPSFPPRAPPLRPQPSSEVLAADLHRQDVLENRAVHWIEQELMARLISDVYKSRPASQAVPAVPSHSRSPPDVTEDSLNESSVVMEPLGQDGMQMFVDAGQPVDEKLVNVLIRECLAEKIASTLGQPMTSTQPAQKTSAETMNQPPPPSSPVSSEQPPVLDAGKPIDTHKRYEVKTPVPTPSHSPVHTPPQVPSPPHTPDLTPTASLAEQSVVSASKPVIEQETDAESSMLEIGAYEKKMAEIQREETSMSGAKSDTGVMSSLEPKYDVVTPTTTPPPELPKPSPPRTPPSLSLSAVEPSKEVIMQDVSLQKTAEQTPEKKVEETVAPSISPQPWGDPLSVLSDANPNYDSETPQEIVEKLVLSKVDKSDVKGNTVILPAAVPRPVPRDIAVGTEDLKPKAESPTPSESASESSYVSDTVNECISEGQWLLQKSLGELGALAYEEVMREKMKMQYARGVSNDDSVASTLHGTDELEDEVTDARSEGQFLHRPMVKPENDPILALLSKMQKPPVIPVDPQAFSSTAYVNGRSRLQTQRSMGEISEGQVLGNGFLSPAKSRENNGNSDESPNDDSLKLEDFDQRQAEREVASSQRSLFRQGNLSPGPVPAPRAHVIQVGGRPNSSPYQHRPPLSKPPVPSLTPQGSKDTMANLTGTFGTQSLSFGEVPGQRSQNELGTRTVTPDQMNVDALIQSGYLSQTFSTDGEMGHTSNLYGDTGTFGQSGDMSQDFQNSDNQYGRLTHTLNGRGEEGNQFGQMTRTLERSEEFTETGTYSFGHSESLGQSVSLHLSGDLNQTNGSFGQVADTGRSVGAPRMVSVTMPSTNVTESDDELVESIEDVSEISLGPR